MTIIRDPTAGSIITNAVDVSFSQNKNYSSSRTLSATHYKGTLGDDFDDGATIGEFFVNHNSRLAALNTDWVLPQGSAIGIKMNPNLSSGASSIYIVLVTYIRSDAE